VHRSPCPCRSPPTRSPRGDHAHGGDRVGAGHHRSPPLPMSGRALSGTVEGSLPFLFLLPRRFCSASLLAAALLRVDGHHCPPLSPTKPGNRTAVTPSTCSGNRKTKSPTNNAGKSHSPSHYLPLVASPLTVTIRAPPASPPHPGGPCESVVQPHLHLCRWQLALRITIELSSTSEFLAIAPSLR
jgi:hypothetical protein